MQIVQRLQYLRLARDNQELYLRRRHLAVCLVDSIASVVDRQFSSIALSSKMEPFKHISETSWPAFDPLHGADIETHLELFPKRQIPRSNPLAKSGFLGCGKILGCPRLPCLGR